ncbi:hypothetical protein H7J06_11505 [Mycobacterium hodleri]|uniref:hypothetical protein n=1 Tax=Mycolicibacterium hodleri TaxID=49897 RepID=UPI0021F3B622|nr:hypothetical protein [Mycolicibacterium hodleri]MCV7133612.1 hypothetical protein [Mycolicibacterium hodleri]
MTSVVFADSELVVRKIVAKKAMAIIWATATASTGHTAPARMLSHRGRRPREAVNTATVDVSIQPPR